MMGEKTVDLLAAAEYFQIASLKAQRYTFVLIELVPVPNIRSAGSMLRIRIQFFLLQIFTDSGILTHIRGTYLLLNSNAGRNIVNTFKIFFNCIVVLVIFVLN